jgi:hypothetical protein
MLLRSRFAVADPIGPVARPDIRWLRRAEGRPARTRDRILRNITGHR